MKVLARVESPARGFYTGAILHHPPSGDFMMNVAIRTATLRGDRLLYLAGDGVVVDSDPVHEYEECMLKAEAFRRAASFERTVRG